MKTCSQCAWCQHDDDGRWCQGFATGDERGPSVREDTAACGLFEAIGSVGCDDCGACCREAFDSVPVSESDAERLGPSWAHRIRVHSDGWTDLHRVPSPTGCGSRCAALYQEGGDGPWRCDMYAVRPTNCRDLEVGSAGCLFARRRVGLSAQQAAAHPPETPRSR